MKEKIKKLIDDVRPNLQADGGDAEFVDFDAKTGVVKVRLQGACGSCPMAAITLKNGIEKYVKEQIPQVKSVERV
jgi:Fe-S cluster biogenesis protein NfuA